MSVLLTTSILSDLSLKWGPHRVTPEESQMPGLEFSLACSLAKGKGWGTSFPAPLACWGAQSNRAYTCLWCFSKQSAGSWGARSEPFRGNTTRSHCGASWTCSSGGEGSLNHLEVFFRVYKALVMVFQQNPCFSGVLLSLCGFACESENAHTTHLWVATSALTSSHTRGDRMSPCGALSAKLLNAIARL